MLHTELVKNDIVIFKIHCNTSEQDEYESGNVVYVDDKRKTVCICYLHGYQSRSDNVPYEKVCARYNPKGAHMVFGVFSGNSDLLEVV